jgi:hypothetical protein
MMAMIIQLGIYGFGVKRGTLFGEGKVPIKIINCGIMSILRLDMSHFMVLNSLAHAGLRYDEFLIEQSETLRLHRKKATAKARAQADARAKEQLHYWRQAYTDVNNELMKAQGQLRDATTTIRTLTQMKDGQA